MRVEARLNNLRIAPRKVRLVSHSIVGQSVERALVILAKQVKRATNPMETLLKSAIANATNNFNLDRATLVVKEVCVGDGVRLKRYMPKAFGQATPILRRSSKITIVLEGVEGKKTTPTKKKVTKKTENTKEEAKKAIEKVEEKKEATQETKE